MSTNIKLKRSAVQGKVPTTTDLDLGELAINTFDGKLFLKKDDGAEGIVDVTAGGSTDLQLLNQIKNVDGTGSGLDADLLDGQQGSYYLDWTNITNKPDPTVTLTGAVTGSATMTDLGSISITTTATSDPTLTLAGDVTGTATFTNLGNATLTATVADDSHNHIISNVDGLQTALDGKVSGTGDTMTGNLIISSSGTIGQTTPSNGYLQVTDGTNTLALDANEIYGTTDIIINSGGDVQIGSGNRVFADNYHPNADKLTTARNIALTGAVTGNANFDGSGNISIATTATADPTLTINGDASGSATFTNLGNATLTLTVADDSHNHTVSTITDFTAGANTAIDNRVTKTFIDALNVDADTLDSLNSTQFLRSDTSDTMSGSLTVNGNMFVGIDGSTQGKITFYNNTTEGLDPYITASGTVTNDLTIKTNSTNGSIFLDSNGGIFFQSNSSTDVSFLENGNVGIGTTSPSAKLDVVGDVQINSLFNINAETGTTTSTTQTAIATFAAATYSSAKFVVQAKDTVTSEVHVTEILVVHDGTTASATEYGTIHTGSAPLATYDVDISSGNVRLLATAASTNSTTYKVTENLITA